MNATDDEKAEATADVDDEFARRQQQMETAIIQVETASRASIVALWVVYRFLKFRLLSYVGVGWFPWSVCTHDVRGQAFCLRKGP